MQAQKFKYGVQLGVDIANTTLKINSLGGSESTNLITTFNLNGIIEYNLTNKIGISIEPGFMQKGKSLKVILGYRNYNNYIQMPILANIHISNKLYISCGPEISYLLNADIKPKDKPYDTGSQYDTPLELSGILGINYNIYKNLFLCLRYNRSLTHISKNLYGYEDSITYGYGYEYNQYLQLLLKVTL